jgi:hypothetical protein
MELECSLPYLKSHYGFFDRLCGLMIGVPGHRSRGSGLDFRHYQIFWEVVGLERGLLSLVSTIEELLGRNTNGSGFENREYGRRDPLCWPRNTLYAQKLALTSPTSGCRSLGIVCLQTQAMEFVCSMVSSRCILMLFCCVCMYASSFWFLNWYAVCMYFSCFCAFHLPWASLLQFYHFNEVRWEYKFWSSSSYCISHVYLLALRTRYFPQYPVLKHPQSMFHSSEEFKSYIQNSK